MAALSTWPSTVTSHERLHINFPEPTDQSSFRGVQIHHQNWSSVLRSRVNRLLNIYEQKNCIFDVEIGLPISILICMVDGRPSVVRHFTSTIFWTCVRYNLYMHSCLSCLNGYFLGHVQIVFNYLWSRSNISSSGFISILPKTDVSKSSVRIILRCTGAEINQLFS